MNQIVTTGIVLSRTEYGEADRILTILTPDVGKIRVIAKGVRRMKSKLAGGIELFSVSELSFIKGRGEIGTLTSARLTRHYGNIVTDIERIQLGYRLIAELNKATEDAPEPDYFIILEHAFMCLNEPDINLDLISLWFYAQLLRIAGHTPNLRTDSNGAPLSPGDQYAFDQESMSFIARSSGGYSVDAVKVLRLLFANHSPQMLQNIGGVRSVIRPIESLIQLLYRTQLTY
jgi:DNA repair protein RecO (recombination protein O)